MSSGGRPLLVAFALLAAAVGACVIAEPPADLPTLPAQAPTIVRGSVVPPPNVILTEWPDKFIVPIQVADSRSHIEAAAFVDYNPSIPDGLKQVFASDSDFRTTQGSVRILDAPIDEPSADTCHVVEVVVALQLNAATGGDPNSAHTPTEPGGDSVQWFYSPGGSLAGCPTLDAGLAPDAAALLLLQDGGAQ